MVNLQLFKVISNTFQVGRGTEGGREGDGRKTGGGWEGDEVAGSVENKDHLSPQLKL